jgi:hypothetical protein
VYFCAMKKSLPWLFLSLFLLKSLSTVCQPNRDCRSTPVFMRDKGLDFSRLAFSTSDRKKMGLLVTEIATLEGQSVKTYQHPSWKKAGWLGPLVLTEKGEIWVAPVPVINTLENKTTEQNRLWKVDGRTGEMSLAVELPMPSQALQGQNPYGLIGLGYDCDTQVLYASSVSGSTMDVERGRLYAIEAKSNKILGQLDSLDAFGVGVGTVLGAKRLYYGSARHGGVFSIALLPDGTFSGKPRLELSLNDLGPRGDDRARKIRFGTDGSLSITGIEFYYNLTAPTEKQETVYQFKYNEGEGRWRLTGMQ